MRRVVVKIGTSSLTDRTGGLSLERLGAFVSQVIAVHTLPCHVTIVTSGAVAAGVGHLGWRRASITIPEKQAAAAVGQGLLIGAYQRKFQEAGISTAQLLLTRSDIEDRRRFVHIRNTLETLLKNRIVPIVNENDSVAVDEIRFGDNDTLASLVTLVANADLLVLLTDQAGFYDADPRTNPAARLIPHVFDWTPEIEAMATHTGSTVGTGGMSTKLKATQVAAAAGIQTVIAASHEPHILTRILAGEEIGTRFHCGAKARRSDKRAWLRVRSQVDGHLRIDHGAAEALVNTRYSLLLPGIVEVNGHFQEGAVVDLWSPDGERVARGAVNFAADDLRLLLKRRHAGEALSVGEVIHRNELLIWDRG
ncbi:MAG: glutamate 5-kinase [Firmicutes bacterium]|nr:glutamate 5-kinase [Bacillota bacterium]